MRRLLLGPLAGLLTAVTVAPAIGQPPEARWVAYVTGNGDGGALVAVRSDGRGSRTLLTGGVVATDLGPDRRAHALVRRNGGALLRAVSLTGGEEPPVARGNLEGIAVAPGGALAVQRSVPTASQVPEHLAPAARDLTAFPLSVLAPPERPMGTTHTVADATRGSYRLLFTNDPQGRLSHAEQINVFVAATTRRAPRPPDAVRVDVRGTSGSFSCGASACFLDWEEGGVRYSIGEFGTPGDAAGFAESLAPMEELAGPGWRSPGDVETPQLVVLEGAREEVLEAPEAPCPCSFEPVDWDAAGERLLVVATVEGTTSLLEYGPGGERRVVEEGQAVLDAAYGEDGILLLLRRREGRSAGTVEGPDGERLVADAISFDAEGSTLAFVRSDGEVAVLDLVSGGERTIGERGATVSVAPRGASPDAESATPLGGSFPLALIAMVGGVVAALGVAGWLLARARRR